MCNQTFCTFAAPNCGILFDYYLVYFSITIYMYFCNLYDLNNEKYKLFR